MYPAQRALPRGRLINLFSVSSSARQAGKAGRRRWICPQPPNLRRHWCELQSPFSLSPCPSLMMVQISTNIALAENLGSNQYLLILKHHLVVQDLVVQERKARCLREGEKGETHKAKRQTSLFPPLSGRYTNRTSRRCLCELVRSSMKRLYSPSPTVSPLDPLRVTERHAE